MPTAHGFVKSDGNKLVGAFDLDGGRYHLSVDIKPRNQSFDCSNATLIYSNLNSLIEDCKLTGTIGKNDIWVDLGRGTSIAGLLDAPRLSSVLIRGAGTWTTSAVLSLDVSAPTSGQKKSSHDAAVGGARPSAFEPDAPEDSVKLARERLLLESGDPIIA